MLLDVGEDCLILHGADGNYKLDLDLPFDVNNEETGAQFNRKTKVELVNFSIKTELLHTIILVLFILPNNNVHIDIFIGISKTWKSILV